MCITMYIMRTCASGHGGRNAGRGGEEREKDRNGTEVGREEWRRGRRRESKRRDKEERREWLTIRERKTTIKGGHADEGKG